MDIRWLYIKFRMFDMFQAVETREQVFVEGFARLAFALVQLLHFGERDETVDGVRLFLAHYQWHCGALSLSLFVLLLFFSFFFSKIFLLRFKILQKKCFIFLEFLVRRAYIYNIQMQMCSRCGGRHLQCSFSVQVNKFVQLAYNTHTHTHALNSLTKRN